MSIGTLVLHLRRLICFFFGHRFYTGQHDGVLATICTRCLKVTGAQVLRYTARHKVTHGDIEKRMAANPPEGYRFIDCNWKKRKAKFVNANGTFKFVAL
jgi:hypothetical protein